MNFYWFGYNFSVALIFALALFNFFASDLRYALRYLTQQQFCQRGRAARIVAAQYLKLTPLQLSHLHQNKGHVVHILTFLHHTTHGSQFVRDDFIGYLLWNSQPHFLLEAPFSNLNNMAKRGTFNSTQALELILQEGSDDKTEVDHYESSNKSVEDEDFLDDVPEINDDPDYLSDEDLSALLIV